MHKWYVGRKWPLIEAFPATSTPTAETCPYYAVVGPFRTTRAAWWYVAHPGTTCQTVSEIEYVAALEEVQA